MNDKASIPVNNSSASSVSFTPAGLEALYTQCRQLYPDQPNPLQVTAVIKYWLGGPDPLDYISMYSNNGDPENGIPPHWHYISFGLSDLHGDGRVHEISNSETPSGFGFELTFRLKRELEETSPPTWPATVMQALAKYVFQSENTLCAGDHISWHCPLDNSESRIQHMLTIEDPQLSTVQTPFGSITYVQIVGVCADELQAAQQWNGPGITELMKRTPGSGSLWLVTDMRRGETIFELDPHIQEAVDHGIALEGSNLSGVSAKCSWRKRCVKSRSYDGNNLEEGDMLQQLPEISELDTQQIKSALKKGLKKKLNSNLSLEDSYDSTASDVTTLTPNELLQTENLDAVHITLNLEAGFLLPLALKGRLRHGRHFTFKGVVGDVAITLLPSNVTGAFVTEDKPFAIHGPWLQILLTEENINKMLQDFDILLKREELILPKIFSWPGNGLAIEIIGEEV